MCTVSFVPARGRAFITSSRDEKIDRSIAHPPAFYSMQSGTLLFPKDPEAGGSWFTVHENGNTVVLLNGGRKRHLSRPPYLKSRGLVLLEISDSLHPVEAFKNADLRNIEPFTVIIFAQPLLMECRWDGRIKYSEELSATEPHIWSSVTLYDAKVSAIRAAGFQRWCGENPEPGPVGIIRFHQGIGGADKGDSLILLRERQISTVSITCAEITNTAASVLYHDQLHLEAFHARMEFKNAISVLQ
jgi:hypothetical protein